MAKIYKTEALVEIINSIQGEFTVEQYRQIVRIPIWKARDHIIRLQKLGIIERVETGLYKLVKTTNIITEFTKKAEQ